VGGRTQEEVPRFSKEVIIGLKMTAEVALTRPPIVVPPPDRT
jgi:hypothetical protein